ncbi:MAG: glycosyl hydrolase [Kiritimatiellae bacterium]|nr:glycosyl hydrolase [Kiritimatiellia bacterium]
MNQSLFRSARPYTRWWWFSGPVDEAAIRHQLDWAKANGFGGVEIAWMYPQQPGRLGAAWLSEAWARDAQCAAALAAERGLGCDFTMGSAWPFGGFHVPPEDAARTYRGLMPQRLHKSWEASLDRPGGPILNHLDRHALERYARRFGAALGLPWRDRARGRPGLFCDSWEVPVEGLWTEGFGAAFLSRYGYDILPLMPELDAHPDARYDYRALLGEYVLEEFYRPFTELCHELGAYARVQCHGAPTDIVAAYRLADVPESEAILFDPDFSTFAASAAALDGKPVVSAEAFTCIYGWVACPGPGPHQGEERLGDLKLMADGLMANGVNQIVWHGMPYNPPGDHQRFYATTHVGPDSPLAPHFAPFNAYLERICGQMRRGRARADVAVYVPLEDVRMAGQLPPELRRPGSAHYWELRETRMPDRLRGYGPLWVTARTLREAEFAGGKLRCGQAEFSWLYVDVEWLDDGALRDLMRLVRAGLPLCLRRRPTQPGRNRSPEYPSLLTALMNLPNVAADIPAGMPPPLVTGEDIPPFWARDDGRETVLFFAHPDARSLRYPMLYERQWNETPASRALTFEAYGRRSTTILKFQPHESALVVLDRQGASPPVYFGLEGGARVR